MTNEQLQQSGLPLYQLVQLPMADRPFLQCPDRATARRFLDLQKPPLVDIQTVIPGFQKIRATDIPRYVPDKDWFANEGHTKSVHGFPHESRVGLYTNIISQAEKLGKRESDILLAAALTHDTQRVNDIQDTNHGAKAAEWVAKQFGERPNFLAERGIHLTPKDTATVQVLCQYHETPYEAIPATVRAQHGKLLQLFMVADALDRYRLPNQAWWPDSRYFGHSSQIKALFEKLLPFAEYFTLQNEYDRLHTKSQKTEKSLLLTGKRVGLVETPTDTIFRHVGAFGARRSFPSIGF